MKKIITIINIFIITVILLSTNVLANNTSLQDERDWNIIGNAVDNAIEDYEEALQNEKEALLKAETLLMQINFRVVLDLERESVQIGDKLYLEYSDEEKSSIYKYMTSNAQKIFEKNTNYFIKGSYNYYDTGRLRTIPFLNGDAELVSLTENKATFNVVIRDEETNKVIKTYKDGLKFVYKESTEEWLIDSFKFKSKVEKDDTYPEYPIIEEVKKEKDISNKKENNSKVEENKNTTNTSKEEITNNVIINNTVVEESNVINNTNNTLQNNVNQVLETGIENNDNSVLKDNNLLVYLICGIVVVIVILIIVAYEKVKNKADKE